MKKLISLLLALALVLAVAVASAETIKLTVWGGEFDQDFLAERVEAFKAAYPDQAFDIQIGVESESTAKDTVLTDPQAAADVYSFASDQLNELINAGALINLDGEFGQALGMAGKTVEDIKAANVPVSIDSATKDGNLYAFPNSFDNGYFLFYDANVFSAEDVQTWDSLLAVAAEKGEGRKVGMTLSSGWYNAGFFYGAGFTTGLNADGTTAIDWNGTAPSGVTGVQVVQAMLKIAADPAFRAIADGDISNQIASGNVCAVVSGTWDAPAAQKAFGDGYAATKLPTYTVGETQVQTGSVGGGKLTGVNGFSMNSGWAVVLADFLTNEESQARHFETNEIGPSNIVAQSNPAVAENLAIRALGEQSAFASIQEVGGKYWDPTATFGERIAQGAIASDDASVQTALDELVQGVTAPIE